MTFLEIVGVAGLIIFAVFVVIWALEAISDFDHMRYMLMNKDILRIVNDLQLDMNIVQEDIKMLKCEQSYLEQKVKDRDSQ